MQGDRRAALGRLQEKYGGVVVLKGANTLVTSKKKVPWLCTAGNPGMASPGMGDVLTGIIAALLAQGLGKEASAVVGVEAHARAGDRAARAGERGTIASDLVTELRMVMLLSIRSWPSGEMSMVLPASCSSKVIRPPGQRWVITLRKLPPPLELAFTTAVLSVQPCSSNAPRSHLLSCGRVSPR